MNKTIVFGDGKITIENIVAIGKQKANIELNSSEEYVSKIKNGAKYLNDILEKGEEVYGVTTGYGDSCTKKVTADLYKKLPIYLTRFHGCGLGKYFDKETTRGIIAVRLCSLARGYSGVTYELLEKLTLLLKHDILPLIPEEGSVGASGDLTPLSYIARTLIGEQEVIYKNEKKLSKDVFEELGITPLELKPKEGLALMNGTSVMTAVACFAYKRAEYLSKTTSRTTALASIALKGNAFHFDPDLFKAKPHPGQIKTADRIYKDLSPQSENKDYNRLQDQYSIRCAPHVIGVLEDALPLFKEIIETEINSSNDNPIINYKKEKIMHGGHFYGGHIAFVMDSLKNLVANISDLVDRQMALLADEKFNKGLSPNLAGNITKSTEKNINHGFKAVQIGMSAWTAEALKNTMPASVFSRSTECHNQDKVSMGTISARDCIRVLELTEQTAAAFLLACAQAITIRLNNNEIKKSELSEPIIATYNDVMENFDFVTSDRPLEKDLRKFIDFIREEKWSLYE